MWKGPPQNDNTGNDSGIRLSCSTEFIKKLLKDHKKNLIILIKLRHNYFARESSHSIGVIEINEELQFKYHKGCSIEEEW